jgi:hypothetical protein
VAPVASPAVGAAVGVYLTDGVRLFRVTDRQDGARVWLEDCGRPDALAQPFDAGEVTRKMRIVRPSSG